MNRFIILLVLMCITCPLLLAQINKDSLMATWLDKNVEDTVRMEALYRLSLNMARNEPDSAKFYSQILFDFARQKSYPVWEGRALNGLGMASRFLSHFDEALKYYSHSKSMMERIGNMDELSTVYRNMGDVYRLQTNYPKAIDCITQSMVLAEKIGNEKKLADSYVSIATIYFAMPDGNAKALEYLDKALQVYQKINNEEGLSVVYANQAAIYLNEDDLENALIYLDKSLLIQQKVGNTFGIATCLFNRAMAYKDLKRYDEALKDFAEVMALFKQIGDQESIADAYYGIGGIYIAQGKNTQAIEMCEQALSIGNTLGTLNLRQLDACDCLYQAHKNAGNYLKSLTYLEKYTEFKDSLRQSETAEKLKQMEIARQATADSLALQHQNFSIQLQHQKELHRKDRTAVLLLAAVLGIFILALSVWVRMLYFKRRSQELQLQSDAMSKQQLINEIALLKTQVNPHFLFNSLSILSSLVHVDPELSEKFIDQLSRSYRYILEQKEQSLVTLRTELTFIQSYAFLLKIRFENKFDLQITLPEDILDQFKIAPLTLQLLVENAVKHNRMSLKEPLIVSVYLEDEQNLIISNRLQPRSSAVISTGVGLQNIIDRYALLTDKPVWAAEMDESFVVKIPLLKDAS
ncbi:MAG: tetratricopeptide repeat protein [Saprospiraceae bacterium]|nr:tetratricopeptide repeat protein [Saprospiraceae bacterium]